MSRAETVAPEASVLGIDRWRCRLPGVDLAVPVLDVPRLPCERSSESERSGVHVEPQLNIAWVLDQVDISSPLTELVGLSTEVDPAAGGIRVQVRLPGHLADAAEDDGDPVGILDRPNVVLE